MTFNVSDEVADMIPVEYANKTANVATKTNFMAAIISNTKVQNPEMHPITMPINAKNII